MILMEEPWSHLESLESKLRFLISNKSLGMWYVNSNYWNKIQFDRVWIISEERESLLDRLHLWKWCDHDGIHGKKCLTLRSLQQYRSRACQNLHWVRFISCTWRSKSIDCSSKISLVREKPADLASECVGKRLAMRSFQQRFNFDDWVEEN